MVKNLIYSRKSVGTALGAVFYIGLVILSLTTLIVISSYQMKYLQARDKMVEWDIKRISENLNIISIKQPSTNPSYTFDITLNNTGGVLVKIVRIYVYDNNTGELLIFDKQTNPNSPGFIKGEIMPGEGNHTINIKANKPLDTTIPYRYRIIVCTERGRQFSFSYPPPPLQPPIAFGGIGPAHIGYLATTFNQESLLYTDFNHVNATSAWENLERGANNVVWHLNITNIGNKDATLLKESRLIVLYMKKGGGGVDFKVANIWYISAPPSSVPPGWNRADNPKGVPGYKENQIIEPNHWEWVAFGAFEPGKPSYYGRGADAIPDLGLGDLPTNEIVWIFLEFHYKYGNEYYSQVIPFVAITLK